MIWAILLHYASLFFWHAQFVTEIMNSVSLWNLDLSHYFLHCIIRNSMWICNLYRIVDVQRQAQLWRSCLLVAWNQIWKRMSLDYISRSMVALCHAALAEIKRQVLKEVLDLLSLRTMMLWTKYVVSVPFSFQWELFSACY